MLIMSKRLTINTGYLNVSSYFAVLHQNGRHKASGEYHLVDKTLPRIKQYTWEKFAVLIERCREEVLTLNTELCRAR